jgi:hypothetical protein
VRSDTTDAADTTAKPSDETITRLADAIVEAASGN